MDVDREGMCNTVTEEGALSEWSFIRLTTLKDGAHTGSLAESSRRGSAPAIKVTPKSEQTTPTEPQAFEWISHGDSTARRRARAHISRGFRRRKALEAQTQEERKDVGDSTSSSSPETQPDQEQTTAKAGQVVPAAKFGDVVDDRSSAQKLFEELSLRRTLGMGGRSDDPFNCFPVKLSPHNQAILDHCKFAHRRLRQ